MNLKELYSQFPAPPHFIAMEEKKILNSCNRPFLSDSLIFFNISSFFYPHIIISVFSELSQCFKPRKSI
jgi:hypothetical protein